ncbi:MAG TPA: hypothetical protein VK548_26855 [Candidatus Acidoferrum sp.]|nr:hypothetical protein [Candidatus Acidoferrum sp.]
MTKILRLAMAGIPVTETVNMETADGTRELELSIRTEKSSYAIGEPVFLEIGLRNTGSRPIKVLRYFVLPADDPNKNNVEIHIYDPAGNRVSRVSHVLTGRALYQPQTHSIGSGETYRDSLRVAGAFALRDSGTERTQALWSLGEDPEITAASEYPRVTRGRFTARVVYRVDDNHLMGLTEAESRTVWKGQLTSNTIEISMV